MNITTRTIESLQYTKQGNAAQYHFDDKLKGFGIRVYPSGRKSFVFAYRNRTNSKRFLTLGEYPSMKAHEARELAEARYYEVKQGGDPQATKQDQRDEITFQTLADRYLRHFEDRKKSWRKDDERLRRHILPTLGNRKLSEITIGQLQGLQTKLLKPHPDTKKKLSKATVNRCSALIKHMLHMAEKWKLIKDSPARHLALFREPPPRDIVLTTDQCKRILAACDEEENKHAAALFKLAMVTGRRVGEFIHAKWKDLDLDNARLTIQDTKANERQHVHLNSLAIEVLESLPRIQGNPHIIAGSAKGKPLYTYIKAWKRILKVAKVDYIPVHGLRHNYASMLVAAGEPLEVVGHLLGHKSSITTRKYAHHRPEQLLKTTEQFATVINMEAERGKRRK